jgi:hypothetical protein
MSRAVHDLHASKKFSTARSIIALDVCIPRGAFKDNGKDRVKMGFKKCSMDQDHHDRAAKKCFGA